MDNNLTNVLDPTQSNGSSVMDQTNSRGSTGGGDDEKKKPSNGGQTPLKAFYGLLKKDDVLPNLPEYGKFQSTLKGNPKAQKALYEVAKKSDKLDLPDYETFSKTIFASPKANNPKKKPKDNDSAVHNFWEGLKQAWYGSKAGAEYLGGELADVAGMHKLGHRLDKWSEWNKKKMPAPDGSFWQWAGSLTGYTVPAVASVAAAPFTGGTSLEALPEIGSLAFWTTTSMGNAGMEYEKYKKQRGEEVSEPIKLLIMAGNGLVMGTAGRVGLKGLLPKGLTRIGDNLVMKGSNKLGESMAKGVIEQARKKAPTELKRFTKHVLQAGHHQGKVIAALNAGQDLIRLTYLDNQDRVNDLEKMPAHIAEGYLTGHLMNAVTGPLSYGSQSIVNNRRRREQGAVHMAQSGKDGQLYELVKSVDDEKFTGFQALDMNGDPVMIPEKEVDRIFTLTPDQFDQVLGSKVNQQDMDIASREPKTIATYNDEDVLVKGKDGEGGYYITLTNEDGSSRDVQVAASELSDFQEIGPEAQMRAEGIEVGDQTRTMPEVLREQQNLEQRQALRDENGDVVYPHQEGYDRLLAQQQNEQSGTQSAIPEGESASDTPAGPPVQVKLGDDSNGQTAILQPREDGSYEVEAVIKGQEEGRHQVPVSQLSVQQLTPIQKGLAEHFDATEAGQGYEVTLANSDPDDPTSPLKMVIEPSEGKQEEADQEPKANEEETNEQKPDVEQEPKEPEKDQKSEPTPAQTEANTLAENEGQEVKYQGYTGTLKKDAEGTWIVDTPDFEIEVRGSGKDDSKTLPDLGIQRVNPANRTAEWTGNRTFDVATYNTETGNTEVQNMRFKSFNRNENNDIASVTGVDKDGKEKTIRDPSIIERLFLDRYFSRHGSESRQQQEANVQDRLDQETEAPGNEYQLDMEPVDDIFRSLEDGNPLADRQQERFEEWMDGQLEQIDRRKPDNENDLLTTIQQLQDEVHSHGRQPTRPTEAEAEPESPDLEQPAIPENESPVEPDEPETKDETAERGEEENQRVATNDATTITRVPIEQIHTDEERFQGRHEKFSQETSDSIVEDVRSGKTNPDNIPPIKLWRDPDDGNLYVVGGHSRLDAYKRLGLKDVQAQVLKGMSEADARDLGKIDNALGTQQTLIEYADLVREWREDGQTKKEIKEKAKKYFGRNNSTVIALSHLDPVSKALDTLKRFQKNETGDLDRVRKFAKYVGEVKKRHPELTVQHEDELFDYLLNNSNNNTRSQSNFISFANAAIDRNTFMGEFDSSKPLNLKEVKPEQTQTIEAEARRNLRQKEKAKREAEKKHNDKIAEIEERRANDEAINKEAAEKAKKKLEDQVALANREYIEAKRRVQKANSAAKKQSGLFGGEEAEQPNEPEQQERPKGPESDTAEREREVEKAKIKKASTKKPWEKTLEEVVGKNPKTDNFARNWNEEAFLDSPMDIGPISDIIYTEPENRKMAVNIDGEMETINARNEYAVAHDSDLDRSLLMARMIDEDDKPVNTWHPVGEYDGNNLGIIAANRGKGAGIAFEKYLMENNLRHGPSIGYSPEGLKTVKRAHKQIVEQAIEEGKDVPDKVLEELNLQQGEATKYEQRKEELSKEEQQAKDDLMGLLEDFDKKSGGQASMGIDPELVKISGKIIAKGAELGHIKFKQLANFVINNKGPEFWKRIFPDFKAAYAANRTIEGNPHDEDLNALAKSQANDYLQQEQAPDNQTPNNNDTGTPDHLESNSERGGSENRLGQEDVQSEPAGSRQGDQPPEQEAGREGIQQQSHPAGNEDAAYGDGEQGHPDLFGEARGTGADGSPSGRNGAGGGGENSHTSKADAIRQQEENKRADTGDTRELSNATDHLSNQERRELQLSEQVQEHPIELGDKDNAAKTLPILFDDQKRDVIKAERRFYGDNSGKGMMFANATGTGKTYTGLGIIYRQMKAGNEDILLVVPSDQKITDWIDDAKNLGIEASRIKDTEDPGSGFRVTTYANFRDNKPLLDQEYDLIVYDESHRLMSNQEGEVTATAEAHFWASNVPSRAINRAKINIVGDRPVPPEDTNRQSDEYKKYLAELQKWNEEVSDHSDEIDSEAKRLQEKTNVVFLSATPFAYVKNLKYADGLLFHIDEGREPVSGGGYNQPDNYDQFFVKNFGYRMRYGKLTRPEQGVDMNLMERNFHERLKEQGAMSARMLDLEQDYSRDFVLADSKLGRRIDEAIKAINFEDDRLEPLRGILKKKLNWIKTSQLLESIKARKMLPRIRDHIDMGRKVVVFHNYKTQEPLHPFEFDRIAYPERTDDPTSAERYNEAVDTWNDEYINYRGLNLSDLQNPIQTIQEEFGEDKVGVFNGDISKGDRRKTVKEFNKDSDDLPIIVAQSDAAKEGISLHDQSGEYQRVMMNLGLPIKPTDAVQTEGRIYRIGNASNAIIEYPVIKTGFEQAQYSGKITTRVRTPENLAIGEKARGLEASFKMGYENPTGEDANPEQGQGGKEQDNNLTGFDSYDKAKTYFYARQKKTRSNKSAEGKDYYATPEPLGLKIVDWLKPSANDDLLEPSAGHGAIARFFPFDTNNKFVEPSYELSNELGVTVEGEVIQDRFENHHLVNKYDGIAMNPPFGHAGKTAMEHVSKATRHLKDGGRIVAILPDSPSMEKRMNKFFDSDQSEHIYKAAEISLPNITFKRAGTSVKPKIVILDKYTGEDAVQAVGDQSPVDISDIETFDDLFDRIKNMDVPMRAQPEVSVEPPEESLFEIVPGEHTKYGYDIWTAKMNDYLERPMFLKLKSVAGAFDGYYSSYNRGDAIKGFLFKEEANADAFKKVADQLLTQGLEGDDLQALIDHVKEPGSDDVAYDDIVEYKGAARNTMAGDPEGNPISYVSEMQRELDLFEQPDQPRQAADFLEPENRPRGVSDEHTLPAEFYNVKTEYSPSAEWNLTGRASKIRNIDDVAYLMRALETKSVENAFAVGVKDGESVVLHLSSGSGTAAIIPHSAIIDLDRRMGGVDKMYFVHNHPSGRLNPSKPDIGELEKLITELPHADVEGLILDTYKNKYSRFSEHGYGSTEDRTTEGEDIPFDVHRFDRQIYADNIYKNQLTSSKEVQNFLTGGMYSVGDKMISIYLTPAAEISAITQLKSSVRDEAAQQIRQEAAMFNANRVILAGRDRAMLSHKTHVRLNEQMSNARVADMVYVDPSEGNIGNYRDLKMVSEVRDRQTSYDAMGEAGKSFEREQLEKMLGDAKKEYNTAKRSLQRKRRELEKQIRDESKNLFGERKKNLSDTLFGMESDPQQMETALQPFKDRLNIVKKKVNKLAKELSQAGTKSDPTLFDQSHADDDIRRKVLPADYQPESHTQDRANEISDQLENEIHGWAGRDAINIISNPVELPAEAQMKLRQESGLTGGFFHNGQAYVLGYNLESPAQARAVLAHEAVGHLGIRKLIESMSEDKEDFQKRFDQLRDDIFENFKDDNEFNNIAERYSLDLRKKDDRHEAAEEFMAHMAEKEPNHPFVQRVVDFMRSILQKLGIAKGLKRADIRNMLKDSRKFVEGGPFVFREGRLQPAYTIDQTIDDWQPKAGEPLFKVLGWHGSPHVFNKFSTDYIGSGEGAQAFGWGLYFTDKESIGRWYAEQLSGNNGRQPDLIIDSKRWSELDLTPEQYDAATMIEKHGYKRALEIENKLLDLDDGTNKRLEEKHKRTIDAINSYKNSEIKTVKNERNLYQVTLHDGKEPSEYEWLDWNEGVPEETFEKIKQYAEEAGYEDAKWDDFGIERTAYSPAKLDVGQSKYKDDYGGRALYRSLEHYFGLGRGSKNTQKAVSKFLLQAGIDGIRYPANQGHGKGHNYVVFDDNAVTINDHIRYKRLGGGIDDQEFAFKKRFDNSIRRFQDLHVDNKRLHEEVKRRKGEVPDEQNSYQDQTLQVSRIENQLKNLKRNDRIPIYDALNKLHNERGVEYEDFDKFLKARHAPERNKKLFERNPDGGQTQTEMSDGQAEKVIREVKDKGLYDDFSDIADRVYDVIDQTNKKQLEAGLMTQRRYHQLQNMFDYYVPMRGFKEFLDHDHTLYSGDMKMKGRNSESGPVLPYMFAMAETAIIEGEKNITKQHLGEMAMENPDLSDELKVRNIYWRKTGEADEDTGKMIYEPTFHRPSNDEIVNGRYKFELNPDTDTGNPYSIEDKGNPLTKNDRYLHFKMEGRPFVIEFKTPHIAQAFKGATVDQAGWLIRKVGQYTKFLRHVITMYSPEFGLRNFIRDSFEGFINMAIDTNVKDAFKALNWGRSAKKMMPVVWRGFKGDYSGKLGKSFQEFEELGGMTGHYQLDDVKTRYDKLTEAINKGKFSKNPMTHTKDAFKKLGDFVEHYNHTLENATRFSVYDYLVKNEVVNPETGNPFTKKQAANYARNITVNFNRRGSSGSLFGNLFLFYNASIQGAARMMKPFFSDTKSIRWRAASVPIITVVLGQIAIEGLRSIMGQDDAGNYYYDQISDWTRTHNMILPNPVSDDPSDYLKIPMPYGYSAYMAMSDALNRWTHGVTSLGGMLTESAGAGLDSFNPIGTAQGGTFGMNFYKTLLPTFLKSGFELSTNKNFAGSTIKPEPNPFQVAPPQSQQYFPWVSDWAKNMAGWMNDISGGDEVTSGLVDVSPEYLEYIVNYYGGGTAKFISEIANTGTTLYDAVNGEHQLEKSDMYRVPFAHSYYGVVTDVATRKDFYSNVDKIKKLYNHYNKYIDKGMQEKADDLFNDNQQMMLLKPAVDAIAKQMRYLRKMQRGYEKLAHKGETKQKRKDARGQADRIGESIHELHLEFNKRVNKAKENNNKHASNFLNP